MVGGEGIVGGGGAAGGEGRRYLPPPITSATHANEIIIDINKE
jgi:hypothetical protein